MNKTAVVALGGNAIIQAGQKGTFEEQSTNIRETAEQLVELKVRGYKLILTHGNGPQAGNLLLMQDSCQEVPSLPLDVCGAETQGQIGYMLQQALRNCLDKKGVTKTKTGKRLGVMTLVTQVVVDKSDPDFQDPTKFVGPHYDQSKRAELEAKGYTIKETAKGTIRRVVPSPDPIRIIEIEPIKRTAEETIIIASGGGGVPVIETPDGLKGVEAVIDKDLAGQCLATQLDARLFIILTDVEKVSLNYNKENEQKLDKMTVAEAKKYLEEGQFPPGSMGPKVRAAIRFIEQGGKEAIITSLHSLEQALDGKAGTLITS